MTVNKKTRWVIYAFRFPPYNEIKYIGQTVDYNTRMLGHKSDSKIGRLPLYVAIRIFGWSNVKIEILEKEIKSQTEANQKERFYIRQFNTVVPNGYNVKYSEQFYKEAKRKKENKPPLLDSNIENPYVWGDWDRTWKKFY